jgi:hypothetical protein
VGITGWAANRRAEGTADSKGRLLEHRGGLGLSLGQRSTKHPAQRRPEISVPEFSGVGPPPLSQDRLPLKVPESPAVHGRPHPTQLN